MSFDLACRNAPELPPMRMRFHPADHPDGDVLIAHLSGHLSASATGPLCDALVAHIRDGWRYVLVELGAQTTLTRPGLRGLVVAAKLLQSRRGHMRLCGAPPALHSFAARESFSHLLRFDPDRRTALTRIGAAQPRRSHQMSKEGM